MLEKPIFKRIPNFKSPLSSHIVWLIESDMKVLYFKMQLLYSVKNGVELPGTGGNIIMLSYLY